MASSTTPARSVISVLLRPPVGGEIEHLVLALAAEIDVDIGNHLLRQALGLRNDTAVGIDVAGAADQTRAILLACLCH